MQAFARHGGRLLEAQAAFPQAPRPWLDLSTGVSPFPYPAPRALARDRARLPDPERLRALETAAARAFGADAERVAATAGAEAALRLLPCLLGAAGRRVAVSPPTYGGHAEAWAAAGAEVTADGRGAAVRVRVNPNNPDGRTWPPGTLLREADDLADRGGRLVVDESFADLEPHLSVAAARHPAVVVLRSFGKAYGLPGLRLGFVVAEPALAARVRQAGGDWPVSVDALAAGLAAYADPAWLVRVRARLRARAGRLDALLTRAGFTVVGGTSLFRLATAPDAAERWVWLARAGVLVRPFVDAPERLRFGLPPPGGFGRLARALEIRP